MIEVVLSLIGERGCAAGHSKLIRQEGRATLAVLLSRLDVLFLVHFEPVINHFDEVDLGLGSAMNPLIVDVIVQQ